MLRRASLCIAAAALSGIAFGAQAHAATVTYTSNDQAFIGDGSNDTSALNVPSGRPPVQSVEVTNFALAHADIGANFDMVIELTGPKANSLYLITNGCADYEAGTSITISDTATGTFPGSCGPINNPQTGSFKPQDYLARTFGVFAGAPASGTWSLIGLDRGGDGDGFSMGPWSLRITHEPLSLTTTKVKRTTKGVTVSASCNGACTVKSGGQAKSRTFQLRADTPRKLNIPLKPNAVDAGKAKVALTATNDIGDSVKKTVKAKRKR